jgi:hypothetical protein
VSSKPNRAELILLAQHLTVHEREDCGRRDQAFTADPSSILRR